MSVVWCVVQKYWPLAANSGWRPEPCPCRSCCHRSCRCSCCYRSFHSCCRSCHGYHLSGDTGDKKKKGHRLLMMHLSWWLLALCEDVQVSGSNPPVHQDGPCFHRGSCCLHLLCSCSLCALGRLCSCVHPWVPCYPSSGRPWGIRPGWEWDRHRGYSFHGCGRLLWRVGEAGSHEVGGWNHHEGQELQKDQKPFELEWKI